MSSKEFVGGFDFHPRLRPTSSGNLGYIPATMAMDAAPSRRVARDEGVVSGEGQPSPDPVRDLLQLLTKLNPEDGQRARDLLAELGIEMSPEMQTGTALDSAPLYRVYARTSDTMTKRFGPVVNRLKSGW